MQRGQSVRRLEDHRFLTGQGRYLDDLREPSALFAHVVRSPHSHAVVTGIDAGEAARAPGVVGVFTAADLAADGIGAMPCVAQVPTEGPLLVPPRFALAADRVRHVGEPVAFVVADSAGAARDAADLLAIGYDTLPCVTDAEAALAADAPLLWDEAPGNLSFRYRRGDADVVAAAFAAAAHVAELRLVNNRVIVAALEPRAGIARFDPATGTFHLVFSGQGVHGIREQLARDVFHVADERMQLVCPDVGGGFGVKNCLYPEYILLLWAARRLGRPVRWSSDRSEDFVSTAQGRDNITRGRLALDAEGHMLALDVATVANLGAAMSSTGPGSSTTAPANAMGGGYAIPAIAMEVRGAFTNTVPVDAYRGAGKPEANYLIERLIYLAAPVVGIDAIELRRRNLVSVFPHCTAMGCSIDGGRFAANIDVALTAADHAGFAPRRAQSHARGMLRGIGVACFLETARGAADEGAEIRFEPDGRVALLLGTQSNGQGHETSFPQIAADLLGLPIECFRYVQADTRVIPAGHGHGGARSLHMGGSALVRAAEAVLAKARPVAARLLQAEPGEVAFEAGRFSAGARGVALLDVAEAARELSDGLDCRVWNPLDIITFPNGCHVAEVEVDPQTGRVWLRRYTAADDFGTLVNPMLALGQVRGGVAQGIGQAMLEHSFYDPQSGQLLSGSFMDYALPRADDLPDLDIALVGVATDANPLGVKGAGQAGAIAAPQAVVGAVADALGIAHIDMPLTPERVWRAISGTTRG